MPSIEPKDYQLANPTLAENDQARYAIHAKNLLQHLTQGAFACGKEGDVCLDSPLAHPDIRRALLQERDPQLLDACRVEMQQIYSNLFNQLNADQVTLEQEKHYELFQKTLLGAYPFLDPAEGEKVFIPQKIDGKWQFIDYQFTRLDISPQSGPLAWVLDKTDRIYAYGLTTNHLKASSHLLFMGTTYPAGQGAKLADLYNYYPNHSVGEAHDMTAVNQWLKQQGEENKIREYLKIDVIADLGQAFFIMFCQECVQKQKISQVA